MKTRFAILAVVLCTAAGSRLQAQTLNWGSEVGDMITDSNGEPFHDTLIIELGAFFNDFVPDETNTGSWLANWRVFDQAIYNDEFGYFSSTVYVENDVTSSNPSASSLSFAGLNAYIWIRNGDDPQPGSEWLLTRADSWTFPLVGGDCCDTDVIEWSITDLDSGDTPEWGSQNSVTGSGVFTTTTSGLQTHTFIPEPSSAFLSIVAGLGMVMRRRRNQPEMP